MWLGSSARDLANPAEAISFLCMGRVLARLHIFVLPRPSVVKVRFEMFLSNLGIIILSLALQYQNITVIMIRIQIYLFQFCHLE